MTIKQYRFSEKAAGDDAEVGDRVKIIDGPHRGKQGVLVSVDPYKVKVNGQILPPDTLWYNMEE